MLYANPASPKAQPLSLIEQLISSGQLDPAQAAQIAPQQAPQPQTIVSPDIPQAPALSGLDAFMQTDEFEKQSIGEMPNAPAEKKPGFIGRIRQQPGGSRALLALGASLLSNKDFFSGLGQGAMAYQGVLDEEAEKLKEKNTLVADGRFISRYDPKTGKYVFERTSYADFDEQARKDKLETSRFIAEGRNQTTLEAKDRDNETELEKERMKIESDQQIAAQNNDFERWKVGELNKARIRAAEIGAAGGGDKPMPASVMKIKFESQKDTLFAEQAIGRMDNVINNINSGKLKLNLVQNGLSKLGLTVGADINGQNAEYQDLETTLQFIRNAKLRLNTGVQTNFDAQVAMLEVAVGKGDERAITAAFNQLKQTFAESNRLNRIQEAEIDREYSSGGRSNRATTLDDLAAEFGLDI